MTTTPDAHRCAKCEQAQADYDWNHADRYGCATVRCVSCLRMTIDQQAPVPAEDEG